MMGDITPRLGVLLVAATIAAPALAQTPAEDVTAAMQGQLAAEVLEGASGRPRASGWSMKRPPSAAGPAMRPNSSVARVTPAIS
jgi:hypothetical protein